jgi:hypothetical protein
MEAKYKLILLPRVLLEHTLETCDIENQRTAAHGTDDPFHHHQYIDFLPLHNHANVIERMKNESNTLITPN